MLPQVVASHQTLVTRSNQFLDRSIFIWKVAEFSKQVKGTVFQLYGTLSNCSRFLLYSLSNVFLHPNPPVRTLNLEGMEGLGVGRNYKKQGRKVPLIDHPNKAVQNLVVIVYLSYMVWQLKMICFEKLYWVFRCMISDFAWCQVSILRVP